MWVKNSSSSSTKEKKNNTKQGKFKRKNGRENARENDPLWTFSDTGKGMSGLPKEKWKYISYSYCWIYIGGFIPNLSIYNFLQGF